MRLPLSLLLLLLAAMLFGQTDFHRYYDLAGRDDLRDLLVLRPDHLVGIGISAPEDGPERTSLLLLDGAGGILSVKTLDFPARTRGMALARQTDSTFWMGVWQTPVDIVDDWVVYRVNANTGNVIGNGFGWGDSSTDEQIRAMAPTPGGGVVVVGNTGDENEAIISRLAADGTEIFRRGFAIPGNRFTIFTDVAVLPGGDVLAAGGFRPNDEGAKSGYFLARIDPAGTLVWSQRYDLDGALSADGGGLSLELLDQGLIALVGTGVAAEARRALVLLVNANGGIEGAFRGEPGTIARDALSVPGQNILVAGVALRPDEPAAGMVARFALTGDDAPLTTLVGNPRANNAIRGIRRRPGGGYYLFGSGGLCADDADADALLVSIGGNLVDEVANCDARSFRTLGFESGVTVREAGALFAREDPRFVAPDFVTWAATTRDQFCPRLELETLDLPEPVCYREPFFLFGGARVASPAGSVSEVRVSLGGADAGAGEFLEVGDLSPALTVVGNGSRELLLRVDAPGTTFALEAALAGLRYGLANGAPGTRRRTLTVTPYKDCSEGPAFSLDFSVRFDGNPLAALPIDTTLCPGGELLLTVPLAPGTTIGWSNGATTPTLAITEPGTYGLTVTNECGTDSTTITVEERETETLEAKTLTLFACLGDSLPFTADPEADVSYRWADGPTGANRVFRESDTYELVRTNPCSEAITTVNVTFQDCCQLYVPSAFSPNGDGINDVFRAFPDTDNCQMISGFQLRIFDRWGGEVYAGTGLTEGWDGRARGEAISNGHFVYSISYFNGLETVRRSGGVVLLR